MSKIDDKVKQDFELFLSIFKEEEKNASTLDELLHAYARYTGRLEGIINGLIIRSQYNG